MPIWADVNDFLLKMDKTLEESLCVSGKWLETCQHQKNKYPVVLSRQWEENGHTANVYAFIKYLSNCLPENSLTAVFNGACCVVAVRHM